MSIPLCDAVEHSPAATSSSTPDAAPHANAQEPWRTFEL